MGYVRVPENFTSVADDYEYVLEVNFVDPVSFEEIHTSRILPVKLPVEYKPFVSFTPVNLLIENRILVP